jgi:hypothetical protein
MTTHRSIAVLLSAAVLSSCSLFDKTAVQDITGPTATTARIKFNNFSPSSVGVNFFANDVKMTGISTTACTPLPAAEPARANCLAAGAESATGVVYGGNAAGGLYVAIAPGQYTLAAKMAAKDTVVSSVAQTIENGKYYSFFMSGIYNTTAKTAEAFVVEDPIPAGTIDFDVAHVRLVNAVPNGTGDLNLFATIAGGAEIALGGATAYKAAGTFIAVPEGTYDVRVAYTGGTTSLIARPGLAFEGGKVYTITARGNTATATTLALDFTQNQR